MIDKKKCDREGLIRARFNEMIDMAEGLPSKAKLADYANENKYIRIGGEQYVGVSLDDKAPLCGFKKRIRCRDIEKIKEAFRTDWNQPNELCASDWEKKKERRLQAFLVKEGLKNTIQLSTLLKVDHLFDELIFCLDEVSLGDKNHPPTVRCDMLCVGKKDGAYFPVIIELKSTRSLGRLVEQLDNFINVVKSPKLNGTFNELLKKIAGLSTDSAFGTDFKKMIVWPKHDNPRKATCDSLDRGEVIQVEYTLDDEQRWSFCCKK